MPRTDEAQVNTLLDFFYSGWAGEVTLWFVVALCYYLAWKTGRGR